MITIFILPILTPIITIIITVITWSRLLLIVIMLSMAMITVMMMIITTMTHFISVTVIMSTLLRAARERGRLAAERLDLWHLHLLLHGLDHGDVHLGSKLKMV